jgi:AraC-like DNA-binding protein
MAIPTPALPPGARAEVSTDAVHERDRLAFWSDAVCKHMIEVECTRVEERTAFEATLSLRSVGQVDISMVRAGGMHATRTAQLIAGAGREYFILTVQGEGKGSVRQDGREAMLREGDITLFSSARRFDLAFPAPFSQTVLILPADALRALRPDIDGLSATVLPREGPCSALLASMAAHCHGMPFDELGERPGLHAGKALLEIVVAAAAATGGEVQPKLSRFHMARIRQFVTERLGDAELSVKMVSLALQISPAHIHRLFATQEQSFSNWMWGLRLAACKRALEDPSQDHVPISHVAFAWGFNNTSHFARVFKASYDASPRAWRERHRSPLTATAGRPQGAGAGCCR